MTDETHDPELSTNEDWCGIMVRARKAHGLTQEQLGAKVGCSQVMIHKIETGGAGGSSLILAICRELDIPEPVNFADDDRREWWQFGHVLRQKNPEGYAAAKQMMRTLVKQLETAQPDEQPKEPEPPVPIRRK